MNPFDQFDAGNPFDAFDATPGTVTPAEYTADVLRKFKQGASLGFGDEISGALKATLGGRGAEGRTWSERYQSARDYERRAQEKASKDAPVSSFIAEAAGSIAPSIAAGGLAGVIGGAGRTATTTLPAVVDTTLPAVRTAANGLGNAMGTGAIVGAVQGVGDTEDMMDTPLAAVRGSVVGSLGGAAGYGAGNLLSRLSRFTNTAPRVADAPTTGALKKAAQDKYSAFENSGGLYTQQGLNALSDALDARLSTWQPELAPGVTGLRRAMARLRMGNAAPGSAPLMNTATPTGLQNLRMVAEGVRDTANNKYQSRLGRGLVEEIDKFIANPQAGQYVGPQDSLGALSEANKLWSQFSKADAVDQAFKKAENRAASTYSGGNENNAIRQELRKVWEKRGESGFTPDENAAFKTAVHGGRVENIARLLGKLAPSRGGLSTWANIGAGAGTGGATLPLTALAEGAKVIGDRATRRNLEEVSRVIRAGGRRRPVAPPPNAVQRASRRLPQLLAGPGAQFGVSLMPGLLGLLGE